MLIDEIQFWDSTEVGSGLASRKPSVSAMELAEIAVDASDGHTMTDTRNLQRDIRRAPHRNRSTGISKQEMCHQLDAIRLNKEENSPKRLQRLYALL